MASQRPATSMKLGPLQQQVLSYVWEHPHCSVRDCRDAFSAVGHELAYTTVQTVFDALHRKRLLQRRRVGTAFHYSARESRQGLLSRMLQELLKRFGAGPEPVASSLVDAVEADSEQLRALIDELKQRGHM